MAGSYKHCVAADGQLLVNEDLVGMLENGGDVYEAVEEMYGMIWFLAALVEEHLPRTTMAGWVEAARRSYKNGLALSPGTEGVLPDED